MKYNYKFCEKRIIKFTTQLKGCSFDSEWLQIKPNGKIIVKGTNKEGYSWDGCSPKFVVFDLLIGTNDGRMVNNYPITYYASMLHDILYQYKKEIEFTRKQVDMEFKRQLEIKKFKLSSVYYFFVRCFGWYYGSFKNK